MACASRLPRRRVSAAPPNPRGQPTRPVAMWWGVTASLPHHQMDRYVRGLVYPRAVLRPTRFRYRPSSPFLSPNVGSTERLQPLGRLIDRSMRLKTLGWVHLRRCAFTFVYRIQTPVHRRASPSGHLGFYVRDECGVAAGRSLLRSCHLSPKIGTGN
jgi:hypothetical protein